MAASGSRRRVAPGSAPRPRPRRRNARLGTPKSAWFPALFVLLLAFVSGQTDDCASRVADALAPVPPEDVTPAMRAGLVTACEGVVAALAAPPAAAGVDQALREWTDAVRRLPRDSDAPLPAPTPSPVLEPRPRAPGSPLTGLTTPSALPTRVVTLDTADASRNGPAVSSSHDKGSWGADEKTPGSSREEKPKAPSAGATASLVVAGAGALVVVLAVAWPRSHGRARGGP